MPTLTYAARDEKGRRLEGSADVKTKEELVRWLQSKGLTVISIEEKKTRLAVGRKTGRRLHKKARPGDLIVFARQFAVLLEAGVPILKAVNVLTQQVESSQLEQASKMMEEDLKAGMSLKEAVAKHPRIFSQMWVDLIETGEATGQLATVLYKLADYFEELWSMRKKVLSSLIYPAVLLIVAVAAILVFMYRVIPIFAGIYKGFARLPALTAAVISISHFLTGNILKIILPLAALGFLFNKYIKTKKGRFQLDVLKLKVPVLGGLFLSIAIDRFAASLSMLLKGGIPIIHALEVAVKSTANTALEGVLEKVRVDVIQGRPISAPMGESGIFPPLVVQMISVGEESGKLAQLLDEVSRFYAEDISTKLTRLVALVEPAILLVMGGIIGILVVAMYLPIFTLPLAMGGGV